MINNNVELEKIDFFNVEKIKLQQTADTKLDTANLYHQINKDLFLEKFESIFHMKLSNFLFFPFLILFTGATLGVGYFLSKPLGFFSPIAGGIFGVVLFSYLFKTCSKLTSRESNLKSRKFYEKYIPELEYVLGKFNKDFNVNATFSFPEKYNHDLYVYIEINDEKYELTWFYKDFIRINSPHEWYDRLRNSYRSLGYQIQDNVDNKRLDFIKKHNMDTWYHLVKNNDSSEIESEYLKIIQKN